MSITQAAPEPATTADLIATSLRADIMQGRLEDGQPLRQDEVAARFGVSKIPVREALFQLKAEGLIDFLPNRGAIVAELSPAEAEEIFVMRVALETAVLRRAIPNLTIANLAQAEKTLVVMDQEKNVARWGELNWEFHATLYAPAKLPRLMEWVKTLHINVARYLVVYLAGMDRQKVSQDQHRDILEACRRGNIAAAVAHLAQHLDAASDQLVEFLAQRRP